MGATIEQDNNGIWVLQIFEALRKEELDAAQAAALKGQNFQDNARLLVLVAEGFRGWVGDEVWNDMTFFIKYGNKIEKIAIVGDAKWKTRMRMFVGAGFRRAKVKYFTLDQLSEAHVWLG